MNRRSISLSIRALVVGLFAAFSAVQLNDPDGLVWVAIYGLVSAIYLASFYTRIPWWLCGFFASSYLIASYSLMPEIGLYWIGIEEGRESLGLLVAVIAIAALTPLSRIRRETL